MKPVTPSQLAELTGQTWRTVKKRLEEAGLEPVRRSKKSNFYASDRALEILYAAPGDTVSVAAIRERTRKDREYADKLAMDNAERRGELVATADAVQTWAAFVTTCRSRLLALPSRCAVVVPVDLQPVVVPAIKAEVYAALHELAAYDPRK